MGGGTAERNHETPNSGPSSDATWNMEMDLDSEFRKVSPMSEVPWMFSSKCFQNDPVHHLPALNLSIFIDGLDKP